MTTNIGHILDLELSYLHKLFFTFPHSCMALPQNDPPSVVLVPPNQTSLLLGSRFRSLNESPYDFSTNLTAGVVARQFTYRMLYWSSSFFTHNLTNIEILLRFQNDDRNTDPNLSPYTYVAYMQPWTQITTFDGHEGNYNSFMNDPLPGSYAAYLQASLNDLRKYESNLAHFPVTVNGGHTITAKVRFNPSRGFVIWFVDDVTQEEVSFLMLDCDWINKGHFIHGFGVFDPVYQKWRPLFYNAPSAIYRRAYYSDSAPTLLYSRYNIVKSRELNRDRRVQSFCSSQASEDFPQEIALIPNSYQKVGVYHTEYIGEDATVIPVRNGTQAQFVRITIRDEFGNDLISGDPIGNFMADPGVPYSVIYDYFDASSSFQSSNLLNYLIFQKLYEPSPDSRTEPEANVVTTFYYTTTTTSYPWYNHTSYSPIYFLPYYDWTVVGNLDDAVIVGYPENFNVQSQHEIPRQIIQGSMPYGAAPPVYNMKGAYMPYMEMVVKNNLPMTMRLEITHWCGESANPWDDTSATLFQYYLTVFLFASGNKGQFAWTIGETGNIALETLAWDRTGRDPWIYPDQPNGGPSKGIVRSNPSDVIGNTWPCRYMERHTDILTWDIPFYDHGVEYINPLYQNFCSKSNIFMGFQFHYAPGQTCDKQPDMRFTYTLSFTRKNPAPVEEPVPDPPPPPPKDQPQPTYTINDLYVPLPTTEYPYCDYRSVLLDDDIIHKINVLPSF